MVLQVGKRYFCKLCGSEFIVTRSGKGTPKCCGQPLEPKESAFSQEEKQKEEKDG